VGKTEKKKVLFFVETIEQRKMTKGFQ